MILYPALEIKRGVCVRQLMGDPDAAAPIDHDPVERARKFEQQGFSWLHVVDIDGAAAGRPVNATTIERIVAAVKIPAQIGGGVRSLPAIEKWLDLGARRVVLGTSALRDPSLVKEACKRFPGRIVASIDAAAGQVLAQGWTDATEIRALELALRMEQAGVCGIIYSDIGPDLIKGGGMALDMEAIVDLAFAVTVPVVVGGGIDTLDDLRKVIAEEDAGIAGAVIGWPLYERRIDPLTALSMAGAQN